MLLSLAQWRTYAADSSASSTSRYPSTYDTALQHASARFLPEQDWLWLKAQCYQESLLNPDAVSHANAKGLCQFLDATWEEETGELRLRASPFNPTANALVAAKYMAKLKRAWARRAPEFQDPLQIAQASYNGGIGNMRKFYTRCVNAWTWPDLVGCVPFKETREYVERIQRHYNNLAREHSSGV